jgi:hypothetical protein
MSEPGSDEISQGMDRRRLPVADKVIRFGRRHRLIAAGCAAVLVIVAGAAAVVVNRKSYPHAWCGPLLTELHVRGESDPGYAAGLARLRLRDHAPVGGLISDLRDYAVAHSVVQYNADMTPSGDAAGMVSTFAAVQSDLRALNHRCSQPPGAYQGDSF